jgi:hypothetical protein
MRRVVGLVLVGCFWSAPAAAQQRPLVTEDPETIGSGLILLEAGLDYAHGIFFPVSGLEGNQLRLPAVGTSIGVSSIAEIQVDWAPYQRLAITDRVPGPASDILDFDGDTTATIDDIVIATKVRFVAESPRVPALGLRFGAKLPTASNEGGMGLDTTDVFGSVLVGKTVRSIRFVGNIGFGMFGDPTRGDRQNDMLLYGMSIARALVQGFEVVGEINGRAHVDSDPPPPGTESRGQLRFGTRYTKGSARVDGAMLFGITSRDPEFGFTFGVTWVFKGFTVP